MFWVFVAIAIVLSLALALATNKKRAGFGGDVAYSLHDALFTPAERSFLGVLETAVGQGHRVFGKVRIADVIKVKSATNKAWQAGFNRISAKHFDFIVCDRATLRVMCAVELDDKTHARTKRAASDEVCRLCLCEKWLATLAGAGAGDLRGVQHCDAVQRPRHARRLDNRTESHASVTFRNHEQLLLL